MTFVSLRILEMPTIQFCAGNSGKSPLDDDEDENYDHGENYDHNENHDNDEDDKNQYDDQNHGDDHDHDDIGDDYDGPLEILLLNSSVFSCHSKNMISEIQNLTTGQISNLFLPLHKTYPVLHPAGN